MGWGEPVGPVLERRYRCPRCGFTFDRPAVPVSCTVTHAAHDCCHYGDILVLPQEQEA